LSDPPRTSTPPGHGPAGFFTGLTYPFRGIAFLARNRAAWRYAVIPGVVNFAILLAALVASFFLIDDLAAWLRPEFLEAAETASTTDPGLVAGLVDRAQGLVAIAGRGLGTALLYALSFVLAAGGAIVAALLVAAGLAGPFQERLSEVVEQLATGLVVEPEPLSATGLARDGARAAAGVTQRALLFAVLYVPLFALSIVPVVGIVGAAGTIVYTSFFGALNFMDPTLERRKLPLRAKLRWARGRLAPWLGYGAGLMALLLIPFVGLVLTPAFVTGGTLLWLDAREPEPAP